MTHDAPRARRARLAGSVSTLLVLAATLAGPALGIEPLGEQESGQGPPRYDVDREFAQGIVRDVSDGGRMLLVELRDDHELLRGTDPIVSDPAIAGDPASSALRADDRRDGRLRKLELGWATGWAFIDDLEGGDPEVVPLDSMYERFRVGQIVEVGAPYGNETTAVIVDAVGPSRGGRPDPRDLRLGATAQQGRVDTIRFEGPIQIRVNRAFE